MTKDYWIPLHLHSDETNGTGYFEIANTYKQYLDYYVEHKLPAIAITNHGNNVAWIDHKVLADKFGIKYIGGIEAYVAMTLDRYEEYPNPKKPKEVKKVYDKFHTIIIALNEQGNKEINQLESDSFNRSDGHFHGRPRIEFKDLQAAVERGNIIVTTACLGGALNHFRKHPEYQAELQQWIDLAINHKDRVFLEVQPHLDKEQTEYNAYLVELAKKYDLKLIASNDIHALNQKYDKLRKIVQLGKSGLEKLPYDNEDTFELWVKTRQEMFDLFKQQGVLTDKQINDALDLTVEVADMVEDFEIDRSVKYPHLYADEEKEFQKRIMDGYKERGIDKLPREKQQVYLKRIKYEYSVYKKMDSLSYMLAHNDIIKAAHNQGYRNGYGRGSVTGSLIAYLIGTTEVDSIRHNLVFERFMNPARVNLPDIDVDFENEGRNWVQQWLLHNDKFHAASILTLGTAQIRNAIALVAAGLDDYTTVVKGKRTTKLNVVESIKNGLNDDDTIPDSLYRAHKELFDWVNMLVGVTMSFGRHAAGIVVDTRTLDDNMGSISLVSDKTIYKVSSVTMHDIDYCNWVKFDILGLDNMGLITRTSKMANLPFLTPDRTDIVNFQDEKVWKSLTRDNVGVFQFEGDRAGRLIADMFSDETLAKIKAKVPNIQYLDLMSLTNAGQRPSGASYIDRVVHGEFNNNGHKALDDFLSSTLGFMVYQETQSQFLVDFCGYDFAHADLIRKGIGKKNKAIMDEEVPKIKPAFIKTMTEKYGDSLEHAKQIADSFIQIFLDSVNYGFSLNHSVPYSYIGYINAWLRYYYPLEFCAAGLQIWSDKEAKRVKFLDFAKSNKIVILPSRFGKSKGNYTVLKSKNQIFEGTVGIKGLNETIGNKLYELSNKYTFNTFTDLLLCIYEPVKNIEVNGKSIPLSEVYTTGDKAYLKELYNGIKKGTVIEKTFDLGLDLNKRGMLSLIQLDYFSMFGNAKKLEMILEHFKEEYNKSRKTFDANQRAYLECLNIENDSAIRDYTYADKARFEFALLGKPRTTIPNIKSMIAMVLKVQEYSNKVRTSVYDMRSGRTAQLFIKKQLFREQHLQEGSMIIMRNVVKKPRVVMVDGKWQQSHDKYDYWLTDLVNSNK